MDLSLFLFSCDEVGFGEGVNCCQVWRVTVAKNTTPYLYIVTFELRCYRGGKIDCWISLK